MKDSVLRDAFCLNMVRFVAFRLSFELGSVCKRSLLMQRTPNSFASSQPVLGFD